MGCSGHLRSTKQTEYFHSLVHCGDWREAAPIPQPEKVSAAPVETPTHRSLTCRSGSRTPESGIWEGRIPAGHPQAQMLAEAPHRFVFKRAGDAMADLGLARLMKQRWFGLGYEPSATHHRQGTGRY